MRTRGPNCSLLYMCDFYLYLCVCVWLFIPVLHRFIAVLLFFFNVIKAQWELYNSHNLPDLYLQLTNWNSDCTRARARACTADSPCSRPLRTSLLRPWEPCWPPHGRPGIPTSPPINAEQLTRRLPLFLPIHHGTEETWRTMTNFLNRALICRKRQQMRTPRGGGGSAAFCDLKQKFGWNLHACAAKFPP